MYYLGIDGGGSVTRAVVTDEHCRVLARYDAGSINYRAIGLASARVNLQSLTAQIHVPLRGCMIGNAALSGPAPEEELHALTDGILTARRLAMDSDLSIALEAMQSPGPCAVAIAGTGSMAAGRAGEGEVVLHTGGWGWLLGDEGSGFDIASQAIRAALRAYEGSGPATALTGELCAFFGADTPAQLLGLFYNPPKAPNQIAAFAARVLVCCDDISREIVRRCAAEFAETVRALLLQLPADTALGLWGGMFQHSEFYRAAFCQALGRQAELLPVPPEEGAARAAVRNEGGPP